MKRLFTDGIIYKIIKYSDSSCIAEAFTLDYGKIKLFTPKAFSKKGGVMKLAPGNLDFLQKESSDLDKLYSFSVDPNYLFFIDEPSISIRLHLLFDIIDTLLPLDEPYQVVYNMILKMNSQNARKALLFSIYAILKNSGNLLDFYHCANCEKEINDRSFFVDNSILCAECLEKFSKQTHLKIDNNINLILRALKSKELYKNLIITAKEEIYILEVYVKHIENISGNKLKSFNSYKEMIVGL